MTRAITINWERLCGCPDQYEIKQPQLFRRLRLLANRLGFETAYIWVIDVGVNVGVHAHVALYWPSRYLSDLHKVFQALDSTWGRPPNNIHDEAITFSLGVVEGMGPCVIWYMRGGWTGVNT